MRHFLLLSLSLSLMAPAAVAQIRLPALPLVSRPLGVVDQSLDDVQSRTLAALSQVRDLQIRGLVRANPRTVDVDDHGNPIVRGELLALSPGEPAMQRAAALHFEFLREQSIGAMDIRVVVFQAPPGVDTKRALRELRKNDPTGVYDFNHIYTGSGSLDEIDAGPVDNRVQDVVEPPEPPATPAAPATDAGRVRVGLLDTGIYAGHAVFRDSQLHLWGCGNAPVAAAHGTEVASLMVGAAGKFRGVQPGAELFVADVYCGKPTGGAVDALLAAFDWLLHLEVPVINVSLVGPPNAMLERAVAALSERGITIVAAVGNDGPAAPPLYPASYPHVVGVTGVDSHNKVLIEAARGPQVMFAAPGADLAAAAAEGYAAVRGTSFAAPIVAALLASRRGAAGLGAGGIGAAGIGAAGIGAAGTGMAGAGTANPELAAAAIQTLAHSATHPGKAGRDLTYGYGVVGAEYRIDPATLTHR
jgi:subtilisin family serine protease